MSKRAVLIIFVVLVLVGGFMVFRSKSGHTTDQAAIAACQKQVASTYTALLDTASLTAPATTSTIQKQEQAAKDTCVTSNTH